MTATPEIRAEVSRTRTTVPNGDGPTEPLRPETAMSADAQRGIQECEATMRECRETIADAWVKLERAIERRALLSASQRIVGITYGE